jgi:FkbM family methyltransferase
MHRGIYRRQNEGKVDRGIKYLYQYSGDIGSFWDIGANMGVYSLTAATNGVDQVVAFEPEPDTFGLLQNNISINHKDNIGAYSVAAYDRNGSMDLLVNSGDNQGIHSLASDDRLHNSTSVDAKRIDTLVEEHESPDLVKIDVEGGELAVLKGATDTLKRIKPQFIIEVHSSRTGDRSDRISQHGGSPEELYSFLNDYNYNIFGIDYDGNLTDFDIDEHRVPLFWFAKPHRT